MLLHPPQITPSSPGNDRVAESTGPSSRFCCLPSQKPHSTPALCTDLPGWQFELRVSTAQLRSSIPGSSNKLLMTLGKSPFCAVLRCLPASTPINKPRWHRKTRLYSRMLCSVGWPRGGDGSLASCTELQEDTFMDDLKTLRSHRPGGHRSQLQDLTMGDLSRPL